MLDYDNFILCSGILIGGTLIVLILEFLFNNFEGAEYRECEDTESHRVLEILFSKGETTQCDDI